MFNRGNRGKTKSLGYFGIVESVLEDMGVDPVSARIGVEQGYGWNFKRGTAIIEIYIPELEDHGHLQVLSPIMHLPNTGLLPLYRRLLEYNMQLTNAALGVYHDIVYVFNERPLRDLDISEASNIITLVAGYADQLDNALVNEFGGRLYSQI